MGAPIAIISFNRPAYLEQTLRSLKAQQGGALDGREIHLFQDGAINAYSGLRYANDDDVTLSIDLFKAYFPEGEVHFWGDNIGICENYYRAEDYFFQERSFEVAYFFEDDLVLSPVYLEMMEILEKFAEPSPRVAYFAAYGEYHATPEQIEPRRREVVNLDDHWAFGLRRAAWAQIREFLAPYYEIVRGSDYARRDHRAIFDLFAASGVSPRASSQDAAKGWACDQLGLWRCRTLVPFARYIGRRGAHMTPAMFAAIGFDRTVVADQVIDDLIFPEGDDIDARLAEQRALYEEILRSEFAAITEPLPARKWGPMRRCTAEDVRTAYRLVLHRDPESEEIFDRHVDKTAVFSLMRGLMNSKEFDELARRLNHF